MTPDDLRKEANAAEFLARVVSYGPDREWLLAKAAALRERAERLDVDAPVPADGDRDAQPRALPESTKAREAT